MKTQIIGISLLFLSMISCQSQDILHKDKGKKEPMPNEKVIVNKTYDKDGNLVAMDSIYTYYYSNMEGDSLMADSIMNNFSMYFNENLPGLAYHHLMDLGSDLREDFYHHDFFERSFVRQDEKMLKLMRSMDSIKNNFFQNFHKQNSPED